MKGKIMDFLVWIGLIPKQEIFYIGGSDILPAPLKGQEEQDALELLEQGDETAKQRLIEHNLRLVVYISRRFENTGVNLEDLISIGTIGLIKAIGTYRRDKNIKLATYASRCIENDGNELLLSDILGTDEDMILRPLEENVDLCVLRQALGQLPEREREIVAMRFGLEGRKELTQKEVAQKMGISQSYISRLEKRIMQRLRKEMIRQTSCA